MIIYNLYSIQDFIRYCTTKFSSSNLFYGHGTSNSLEESILLLSAIINYPLHVYHPFMQCFLTIKEKKNLMKLMHDRIKYKIPLIYLTNKIWYYNYPLYIDQRVIIPRSPLGKIINNNLTKIYDTFPKHILDLGTGSGCLAICCAYQFSNAIIDATDISLKALEVAEINIKLHDLTQRIYPICTNLFNNLPYNFYDLIISNPPYVPYTYTLPLEYSYEPKIALYGKNNKNGLNIIIKILSEAYKYLTNNGLLICEIGNNLEILQKKMPMINFNFINIYQKQNQNLSTILVFNKKQLLNISKYYNIS